MKTLLALTMMLLIPGPFYGQDRVNYTVRLKPLLLFDQPNGNVIVKVPKNRIVTLSPYNLQCDCFSARYLEFEGVLISKDLLNDVYGNPPRKNSAVEISDSIKVLITSYRLANDREPDDVFTVEKTNTPDAANLQHTVDLINKWGYTDGKRIAEKKIWIGMSVDMTLESWGIPYKVNRNNGSWGVREQWVYSEAYLYFENGILAEIFRLKTE